ncbi:MAG: hypothetical protein ABI418_19170, partial [Jatrophihabitantaceae bacterium]
VMSQTNEVSVVTLVLGNNGVQVKSLMAARPSTGSASGSAASTPPSSSGTVITNAATPGCIN